MGAWRAQTYLIWYCLPSHWHMSDTPQDWREQWGATGSPGSVNTKRNISLVGCFSFLTHCLGGWGKPASKAPWHTWTYELLGCRVARSLSGITHLRAEFTQGSSAQQMQTYWTKQGTPVEKLVKPASLSTCLFTLSCSLATFIWKVPKTGQQNLTKASEPDEGVEPGDHLAWVTGRGFVFL